MNTNLVKGLPMLTAIVLVSLFGVLITTALLAMPGTFPDEEDS